MDHDSQGGNETMAEGQEVSKYELFFAWMSCVTYIDA